MGWGGGLRGVDKCIFLTKMVWGCVCAGPRGGGVKVNFLPKLAKYPNVENFFFCFFGVGGGRVGAGLVIFFLTKNLNLIFVVRIVGGLNDFLTN